MMRRFPGLPAAGLGLSLLLSACAVPERTEVTVSSVRFDNTSRPVGVARSNLDLAEDFADLTFGLENGEKLDGLLRYEMPVRVYMGDARLEPYRGDLAALLQRLRREARLDIEQTDDPAAAQILIEGVPAAQLARLFPNAACFIVPGVRSWSEFLRQRNTARTRWSEQETLQQAIIFIPPDTTPQDIRDCLHEEVTQALGPANDLYRLPDTIWNDDNSHGAATPFDMLVLRTLYQPDLQSGMSRADAQAQAGRVLNRINPQGRSRPRQARAPEVEEWSAAIETALSSRNNRRQRLRAASAATEIAIDMEPPDHRLGVSLLTLARLNVRRDPNAAALYFSEAYRSLARTVGLEDVRTAQAGMHLAAFAIATDQSELALALVDRHLPIAIESQNAILVAGLLSRRAEAYAWLGQEEAARDARVDSLRWARYGFGDGNGDLAREQALLADLVFLEAE